MATTATVPVSTLSFLAGLLVWLLVWVVGLGFLGGAVGTAIKGSHPGALLAVPGVLVGLVAYCVHATVLVRRRRQRPSNLSLQRTGRAGH